MESTEGRPGTTSNGNEINQGSLAAYGLERVKWVEDVDELPVWINGEGEWLPFQVRDKKSKLYVCRYFVNLTQQAYATMFVCTGDKGGTRFTTMKYRDMIIDSYKASSGGIANIKTLITEQIVNGDARNSFAKALQARNILSTSDADVEFTRNSAGWEELITNNPFTDGQEKLLPSLIENKNSAPLMSFTVKTAGEGSEYHLIAKFGYGLSDTVGDLQG